MSTNLRVRTDTQIYRIPALEVVRALLIVNVGHGKGFLSLQLPQIACI